MTRPYSSDLRERVVASVSFGRSCRVTAALFGVSVASVVRWSQRYRATGSSRAKPMGGRRRLLLLPQREWLLARIAAAPDLTVRAVRTELAERGLKVSYGAVWSFLAAEGLTVKKNAARRRTGTGRRRAQAPAMAAVSGAG